MKKAFTLAEIVIVLMVIGFLVAVLLPSAKNAIPNEDVMKFKNAHEALQVGIAELVNSDKFYLNGSLGYAVDGTVLDGSHTGDVSYFCNALSSVLNIKSQNCSKMTEVYPSCTSCYYNIEDGLWNDLDAQVELDKACLQNAAGQKKEIVFADGTIFYEVSPNSPFGIKKETRDYRTYEFLKNGFLVNHASMCIDIDGIGVGQAPFGYGVSIDGKIYNGARANEWIKKSIQNRN